MRILSLFLLVACVPQTEDADLDDDGDGLTNVEEEELGTDPEDEDSDGDTWSDKAELDAGSNPTYGSSFPFTEGDYLVGSCPELPDEANAGPTASGNVYQQGDVLRNLETVDSFGQDVPVYPFCGNFALITISAEWCGPCQDFASKMPRFLSTIRETHANFNFIEVLYQDNYGALPDEDVLGNWRDEYELAGIPVVAPLSMSAMWLEQVNGTGYIPASILVDPQMKIIWSPVENPGLTVLENSDAILEAIEDAGY